MNKQLNTGKLFAEFLHDKGITSQYADGYLTGSPAQGGMKFPKFLAITEASKYISRAFVWHPQPEGGAYWSELSDEWVATLETAEREHG